MPRENVALLAMNRGIVSPLALARTDIKRIEMSAETQTNWMPRALGSMMLRPGFEYIVGTNSNNAARYIPFIFSTDDTALIEVTAALVRVLVSETPVTRASVTAAVTNGGFASDVTSWTDGDESGGTSAWVTGGYLGLTGNGTNYAIRTQQVTVTETGTEHALDIVIERGPVIFRCGSTSGGDEFISETTLDTGSHSLAFTPTGDFYAQFKSLHKRQVLVDSCDVASSGITSLTAPWSASDLSNIRTDQSGDVIFIACAGYQQYKIERRATNSWSLVKYYADAGPFLLTNTSTMTMTASALTGNITLTASKPYFKSTNVGSLFRVTSEGQEVTASVSAGNQFTNAIRVTGVDSSRIFTIIRSGTWSGTVTLQRSLDSDAGPWEDVTTYTTNATITYDDTLDNQIAWYRVGVKTGEMTTSTISGATQANPCSITDTGHPYATGEQVTISGVSGMTQLNGNTYTITYVDANTYTLDSTDSTGYGAYTSGGASVSAGPITLTLDYAIGFVDGIARITGYTSETVVDAEVITDLGGTDATDDWAEGVWSDRRGWPTAVGFVEGRLGWAGGDSILLSVTDSFYSFDDTVIGDSGTIDRSIGSGPVDTINWILALQRLILGAEGAEFSCKSSSFDEPLTPTDFTVKPASGQGSSNVEAIKIDKTGIFVQRGGTRVFEIGLEQDGEYGSTDLTILAPNVTSAQVVRMAAQRQPDTRIHCVLNDGTVAVLIFDRAENLTCWIEVTTNGSVEDVVVLPGDDGDGEDKVYYAVNRTINGSTVRYLEKWALESACQGGSLNKQADSFYEYSGSSTTTITGLSHLEGESVVAWGNGKDLGTYTVASGQITLSESVTSCIVGLTYTADYKSSKLAYASGMGTALTQKKKISQLGVIMYNSHYQGLTYGPDTSNLDNLPLVYKGAITAADTIHASYDGESFPFEGEWDTDSRLCLRAVAPKPCTILATVMSIETHDKF